MKQKVLAFLQKKCANKYEQFNEAFELYKQSPEKNHSIEIKLNRAGFSEDGLKNLLYDLQKMHGISDAELATPMKFEEKIKEEQEAADAQTEKSEKIEEEEAADELTEKSEKIEEKEDPIHPVITLADKVLTNTEVPENAPENYKFVSGEELVPIREEFPFLDDASCPEVMFVVVGKRISSYRRYAALHAKLQEINSGTLEVTEEEQAKIASDAQEAFAENRELWEELNYYKEKGEILGKHRLFFEIVAKREVNNMSAAELAKYRTSSATFLSKKRKELKEPGITLEKKLDLEQAIIDREYKLELVNKKLGVNASK